MLVVRRRGVVSMAASRSKFNRLQIIFSPTGTGLGRRLRAPGNDMLSPFTACRHRSFSILRTPRETPSIRRSYISIKDDVVDNTTPQTLTEKIVQKYAVGIPADKKVRAGDYVTLAPYRCMTHDNSWPVALKFMSIGATSIHDPQQIVMTLDHDVQNHSEANQRKYQQIEQFARTHQVDFFPAGHGIGHQIMVEEGYAWPQTVTVASDSHSNMYGGVGALGTPIVRTDAASVWATGRTWWQIPPVARIVLGGTLPRGATGKDVILTLCGLVNDDEVLNHALEFVGATPDALHSLSIDDRLTIANMTTEWGALTGLFPVDNVLRTWMTAKANAKLAAIGRSRNSSTSSRSNSRIGQGFTHERIEELFRHPLTADHDAHYAKTFFLDLSTVKPCVTGPNSVKDVTAASELEARRIKLDKAYLVSCTNSRASDLQAAAEVFRSFGPDVKVADGVKFYVAAASLAEQRIAEDHGDWQVLLAAGAIPLPSGCGPCIGLGTGLLEPGEVGISASNRNFKGRMGSSEAKAYLASPETVAASAISGIIRGANAPMNVKDTIIHTVEVGNSPTEESQSVARDTKQDIGTQETKDLTPIYPDFPRQVSGQILFCNSDNINTDGIYPGKYTYQDGITRETMAQVCMENYDTEFSKMAQPGDILVAGYNFGCGSSREQAATAILAKGIQLVVAGSFGNIFSRNSINNALMGVEVPKLVKRLRERFGMPGNTPGTTRQQTKEGTGNDGQGTREEELVEPAVLRSTGGGTIRTGWTFTWDVERSLVTVVEDDGKRKWTQRVGELSPNVQEIIATGGLEKWVKKEIGC